MRHSTGALERPLVANIALSPGIARQNKVDFDAIYPIVVALALVERIQA